MIDVQNLTKVYGEEQDAMVYALNDLSANVQRGEFVAIMGPSGSGKSTLMNILGCLDRPTSGAYFLDGRDVSRLNKNELADVRNQKIGFVFQSFNLLPRLSALENVMMPMLYDISNDLSQSEQRTRAIEALESVGLEKRIHHHPNQLSGGQQQRVAIARALVNRPPLILADEPTGNLDSKASVEIMDLLHQLHNQGVTVVMVTHEPDIASHAGRIICVRDGKTIAAGHCSDKTS
ncbi:MAG: ABC transporter ATP-binding protein [Chloroflexi bacterium]|nr:ABC transporter ATP-binding protein [Chloroflexota bacterium]